MGQVDASQNLKASSRGTHNCAVGSNGDTGEISHILLGKFSTACQGEGSLAPTQFLGGLAGSCCTDGYLLILVGLDVLLVGIGQGDGIVGIALGVLQQDLAVSGGNICAFLADEAGVFGAIHIHLYIVALGLSRFLDLDLHIAGAGRTSNRFPQS